MKRTILLLLTALFILTLTGCDKIAMKIDKIAENMSEDLTIEPAYAHSGPYKEWTPRISRYFTVTSVDVENMMATGMIGEETGGELIYGTADLKTPVDGRTVTVKFVTSNDPSVSISGGG